MATNGVIRNDFKTGHAVQISWTVNSQNVANNTSNVTVLAQLVSTSSSYTINSTATKNGSLTINGTTYNFTFSAALSGGQTKTVFTKTVDIPHNSDGTKTCSMATTLGINVTLSGTYYGNVTATGSGVFNTIARASSFTLGAYTIPAGTAFTVYITSAVSSFTHNVYYSFGPNSATIGSGVTGVSPTAAYTIPLAHLNAIPNTTSGTGYVSVDTYSGGVYIGTASTAFTITAPSTVIPSFTSVGATVVDAGAATSYGYVQGMSKSTLAIAGAVGTYGSTITGYSITGGGFTGTTASYTTGILNTSGSITFTAKVQDSRGRWSNTKTVSITVNAYIKPSITSYSALRCISGGTLNDDGTYVKAVSTFTYSTVGGLNTLTSTVKYRKVATVTWSTAVAITTGATGVVIGGGLIDAASTYEVILTLVDKFNTVTQTVIVATAFVTLDFKAGGKGVSIGKASEFDGIFEVAMPMQFPSSMAIGSEMIKFPSTGSGSSIRRMTDQGGLNISCDSSMVVFAGDNPIKVENMLGVTKTYEFLNLVADQDVRIITNVQDVLTDGTGGASKMFNFSKNGCLYIETDSTNADSGLRINGSAVSCNIWCGSGGAVLQSLGTANLHLGQNNTTDMIFYPDRIELKKPLVPYSKVSVNKSNVLNDAQISVNTAGDANNYGDGVTHIGYWNGTGFNHYFRGKGTFNMNSTGGVYSSTAIYAPAFTPSSDRDAKYDITLYDTELLYDYVKDLNIYGYRYSITDKQFEGEERYQDMWIGSMVQELPFEVVNYDTTPSGDGKAVNEYSYAAMVAGATKELIKKYEQIEQRLVTLEGGTNGAV